MARSLQSNLCNDHRQGWWSEGGPWKGPCVEVLFTLVLIPRELRLLPDVPADLVLIKPEVAWGCGPAWPFFLKVEILLRAQLHNCHGMCPTLLRILPTNLLQRYFGRITT